MRLATIIRVNPDPINRFSYWDYFTLDCTTMNDEQLIFEHPKTSWPRRMSFILLFAFPTLLFIAATVKAITLFFEDLDLTEPFKWFTLVLTLGMIGGLGYWLFWGIRFLSVAIEDNYNEYIFNRHTGTFSYLDLNNKRVDIPFGDCIFDLDYVILSHPTTIYYSLKLGVINPKRANNPDLPETAGIVHFGWQFKDFSARYQETLLRLHSLLVWYIDRNRPLPPGRVFDMYRKVDDERREKLGFTNPLYPCIIDITKKNTTQNNYLTDDDYF